MREQASSTLGAHQCQRPDFSHKCMAGGGVRWNPKAREDAIYSRPINEAWQVLSRLLLGGGRLGVRKEAGRQAGAGPHWATEQSMALSLCSGRFGGSSSPAPFQPHPLREYRAAATENLL